MFHLAARRAISVSFLLTASIIFQTIPLMNTTAFAQKRKPVQGAPPQPKLGAPLPNPPGVPIITAAKVDAWDDTATPDGKAEPGQTITYTVTISNTGTADATGVTFTDSRGGFAVGKRKAEGKRQKAESRKQKQYGVAATRGRGGHESFVDSEHWQLGAGVGFPITSAHDFSTRAVFSAFYHF
jgi:hypothetical protein